MTDTTEITINDLPESINSNNLSNDTYSKHTLKEMTEIAEYPRKQTFLKINPNN